MSLAVSRGMFDVGVDLVKMILRRHGGGAARARLPPRLPFYFSHLQL